MQVGFLISQSVVLGYLTDHFGIKNPTAKDTRNAYLFAAGKLIGGCYLCRWELDYLPLPKVTSWLNYCAGLVVLSVTVVIVHAHAFLIGQKNGMIARILTTMAIYNKVQDLLSVYNC